MMTAQRPRGSRRSEELSIKMTRAERDAFRRRELAAIPRWYQPWAHLVVPGVVGLALIVFCGLHIHELRPWQLLIVPIVFVVSNATEWRMHKYVLHRRRRFVEVIYDRHTPIHHRVYVSDDMAIREWRELRLIMIPAYAFFLLFLLNLPFAVILWASRQHNLALLYTMTTTAYVLSYEWMHLCFHLPPQSAIGRSWLIRVLRRHHATHHSPDLMQRWNFNVVVPLWDWVRGTTWKGPSPLAELGGAGSAANLGGAGGAS